MMKSKFRGAAISGVLAAAVLALSGTASATVILDQSHWVGTSNASGLLSNVSQTFGRAQTFTAGVAGVLDSIDVQVLRGPLTEARILATAGGAPIGGSGGSTVLASSTSVSNVGDTYTFDLSGASLGVSIGDVLAIELFGSGSWRGVSVVGGGSYAGGSDYFFNVRNASIPNWTVNTNLDWNFRTYVNTVVPEPAALALVGIGLLGLGLGRRK